MSGHANKQVIVASEGQVSFLDFANPLPVAVG